MHVYVIHTHTHTHMSARGCLNIQRCKRNVQMSMSIHKSFQSVLACMCIPSSLLSFSSSSLSFLSFSLLARRETMQRDEDERGTIIQFFKLSQILLLSFYMILPCVSRPLSKEQVRKKKNKTKNIQTNHNSFTLEKYIIQDHKTSWKHFSENNTGSLPTTLIPSSPTLHSNVNHLPFPFVVLKQTLPISLFLSWYE